MTTPAPWLRHIKPLPKDAKEQEALVECFQILVESAALNKEISKLEIEWFKYLDDLYKKSINRITCCMNAIKALNDLPQDICAEKLVSRLEVKLIDAIGKAVVHADAIPRRGKGQPANVEKWICFCQCYEFLENFGKKPFAAALAKTVWEQAGNEPISHPAWVEIGKQARPWSGNSQKANRIRDNLISAIKANGGHLQIW